MFGPLQLDRPLWLILLVPLTVAVFWIARRSLTGLGPRTRIVAIGLRLIVLLMLTVVLAEPRWRRESDDLAVMLVVDASKSMPPEYAENLKAYIGRASENAKPEDRLGIVSAAEDSFVLALPSSLLREPDVSPQGNLDATDIASGVRLAMAVLPEDAAGRIVLVSDGNETTGSILAAAREAEAAGIPIDVLPATYNLQREVIFDRLIAPPTARRGQTVNLRFVINARSATRGRVTLRANSVPVDLDPAAPGVSVDVELEPGPNHLTVPITLARSGPQRYEAVFEPLIRADDSLLENNSAMAVTFVEGKGRVLVYAEEELAIGPLVRALNRSDLEIEVTAPGEGHVSLIDLGAYDAVVLVDTSAYSFTLEQQEELKSYIHDLGGGLLVVGGPNSFGAGGWIGSPLADAFPVKLDPPQKRHMPKGALALIMHSCEMPEGNYWGKQTAIAAVNAVSRLDLVGVAEYGWQQGGAYWLYPMALKGDGAAVNKAINNLTFGDMPDFASAMQLTLQGLLATDASQRHCIIISDGDPSPPSAQLVQQYINNSITISTVAVFPHSGLSDLTKMQQLAQVTGGAHYQITRQNQLGDLPQIFIKEAQTIRRSLIWEGDPFSPTFQNIGSEAMRGIATPAPPISGYVVTAEREGLSLVPLRGPENDPILAQWQYGLGRVVAYTSDAATRWNSAWVAWDSYDAFWAQHIRWAMRPSGSATVNVITETDGDETRVIVDAVDAAGERLNFANFTGRIVKPDGGVLELPLRQAGAGRYEGRFESSGAGAYVIGLQYRATVSGANGEPARVERGNAQAAVTRPFADEHRALRDNAPLLAQVAEITGGRVLPMDPAQAELFNRADLTKPVATQLIWLALALATIGLFLADVAVRRVRIDVRAIGAAIRKAGRKQEKASEKQIGALRTARQRTSERLAKRGADPATAAKARKAAATKFEVRAEDIRKPAGPIVDSPGAAPIVTKKKQPNPEPAGEEDSAISRLRKAKQRARDSMRDDNSDT